MAGALDVPARVREQRRQRETWDRRRGGRSEDDTGRKGFARGTSRRIYFEDFTPRWNEVGVDGQANVVTVGNWLQECAANHAQAVWGDMRPAVMKDAGLAWVLSKQQLRLIGGAPWGDKVRVQTWFGRNSRVSARRDWLLADPETMRPIAAATSTWIVLNLHTRRLAKIPGELESCFDECCPAEPDFAFEDYGELAKIPEVPERLDACSLHARQRVGRTAMDMNGHVNNVRYLEWALEEVPDDVVDGCSLSEVAIEFRREALYGDTIESIACRDPSEELSGGRVFQHYLRRQGDDAELIRARSVWQPKETHS